MGYSAVIKLTAFLLCGTRNAETETFKQNLHLLTMAVDFRHITQLDFILI